MNKPALWFCIAASAFAATDAAVADPVAFTQVQSAPVADAAPAFDWAGFYVGLHGGGFFGQQGRNLGAHAGYNVTAGNFLYGIDVRSSALTPPAAPLEGIVRARLGYLVRDRVLVFGAAGAGTAYGVLLLVLEFGAGVEVAVGDRFSIRSEVNIYGDFMCGLPCGSPPFWSLGLTYHPGNARQPSTRAAGFSWTDPYVGLFGFDLIFAVACDDDEAAATAGFVEVCYLYPNGHGAGLQAGYPFGRGPFVVGPEIQFGTMFIDAPRWAVAANLRAGAVLDEPILLYAEAGIGTTLAPNFGFATLGGGLEISLGQRVSIFGEANGVWAPDFGPNPIAMVQVGLNFHLGGR